MVLSSLFHPTRSIEDEGVGGGKAAETLVLQNFKHPTVPKACQVLD
jgi:hypothetical protein